MALYWYEYFLHNFVAIFEFEVELLSANLGKPLSTSAGQHQVCVEVAAMY